MIFLVEGEGDKRALHHLLRRHGVTTRVDPIPMNGKSNIVRFPRGFEETVRRQAATGGRVFVILVDRDVTCAPYESLAAEEWGLRMRAQALSDELGITVVVYWAKVEFESWLIGGISAGSTYCGMQRVPAVPANTETQPQDPKAWLKRCLRDGYEPRIAECLAQRIDLAAACQHNRSLRTFLDAVAELAALT